ncbi:MAG TPA: aminotransferase class I/II-fold pyridoxal phosphate-dependent enzyme, partial [Bacteroidia bacterium]|nr:aminotransferase class I/II-fold pyridoxal phosphate-dependent enzyme [Bacteroidia bacterium]
MDKIPHIPFNKPLIVGRELRNMRHAVASGHISSGGKFTGMCMSFFRENYGVPHNILTTSCTAALELAACLLNIREGDEVIAPSFAYVSTVNAFVLRGARIVFADSQPGFPNIDADAIEPLITGRTKAIVCVHYSGVACDMEKLKAVSEKYRIPLVEDAAHAIDARWKKERLGTIGAFGALSFHETKNITAGEGGMLFVNDSRYAQRAIILSQKGTNRNDFMLGNVDRYEWVDVGSSL